MIPCLDFDGNGVLARGDFEQADLTLVQLNAIVDRYWFHFHSKEVY